MSDITPTFYVELPYQADSALYFSQIRSLPWPVFLDSGQVSHPNRRFDIIAADPFITLETKSGQTTISSMSGQSVSADDPFDLLQAQLNHYHSTDSSLPFSGGAIGYFSYDLGRLIEKIPNNAADIEQLPEMAIGLYDWAIIVDHQQQQTVLVSHGFDERTATCWPDLVKRLQANKPIPASPFVTQGELRCNMSKNDYAEAFNRIQHYIREGDCYQVNLTKRFEVDAEGDTWTAYQHLRKLNSAPFSAFFETPNGSILSSSPERLLRVHERQVETKPIKGTRPRDLKDPEQDQLNAEALQASTKDRAENLMIVDLLRNDLGKVSRPGSIKVPEPFAIESFATVHHLVSTITSELAEAQTAVSLLRACFPGGSITGAPKLRAMEIIEELEPNRRGVYCGSIGYIGFDGNMDTNIAIRTLIFNQNKLRFWAGGGIVTDSKLADEYQEVLDKSAAMLQLIDMLRSQ